MSDTIYRQKAIDTIKELREVAWKNWHEPTLSPNVVIDALSDLPSAPSWTGEWIPVTERLPEEGQGCLVCDKGQILIDTFIGHGNPYNWKWYLRDYEAWMPLPQPYTEETNAQNNH